MSQPPAGPMALDRHHYKPRDQTGTERTITSAHSQYAPPRRFRIRVHNTMLHSIPECHIPSSLGKVLGRGGSINGMVWVRGNRFDSDGWAEADAAVWDFRFVLPLFKKSEDWEDRESEFRGTGGPIRFARLG